MHIECFIHGNANKQKALDLVDIVENRLSEAVRMSPLLPRQLLLNRELKLEDGCNYLYNIQNDIHKSSCVEIYYQCGMQTKQSNVLLDLFAHIIQEPCFNELRTKQQLGYIVFSGMRRSNGVQGLRIIVQSDRHPEYVDERIEEFLRNMLVINLKKIKNAFFNFNNFSHILKICPPQNSKNTKIHSPRNASRNPNNSQCNRISSGRR